MSSVNSPEPALTNTDGDFVGFLRRNQISAERCEHPAVFTTAEAERHVPPLPGMKAKNLFLHDRQSGRNLLVVVPYAKRVDLKRLASTMGCGKLRFGSAEALLELLGITPGAVSLLALYNDRDQRVELVMDVDIWQASAVQCHPLVNTATMVVSHDNIERFIAATGHVARVLEVPAAAPLIPG